MPNLADVFIAVSEAISRESDDELIVVLPGRGKYMVLNGTGLRVFRLLDGNRSLEDIAAALSEQYAVPLERVQQDVLAFAGKLVDRQAVQLVRSK